MMLAFLTETDFNTASDVGIAVYNNDLCIYILYCLLLFLYIHDCSTTCWLRIRYELKMISSSFVVFLLSYNEL